MKRQLAFALAVMMTFSAALTGCGKQDSKDSSSAIAAVTEEVAEYTEEKPQDNQLIYEEPIPPETGTLELTEKKYKELGFKLTLPPDVDMQEEDGRLTASDSEGKWTLTFEPFEQGELYTRRYAADHGIGEDRSYREADHCDTEIKGYSAFVCAANIKSTGKALRDKERIPEYTIILDYGDKYIGKWAGVQITLRPTKYDSKTNIYDYLYLRHVRSLLSGFEPVKSYGGEMSAGGITVKMPKRWNPAAEGNAITAQIIDGSKRGGITISSVSATNVTAFARNRLQDDNEDDLFNKDYGDTHWTGVIRENRYNAIGDEGEKVKSYVYTAELYRDMGGNRAVRTTVSLRSSDSEKLTEFLDSDVFSDVMGSLTADPSGYSSDSASAEGFTCTGNGYINSYTGQDTSVTIPSEISGVTIIGIADGTFKGSKVTSVTVPAGVTEIGSKAFSGCKSLKEINLPEGVLQIGSSAFESCEKLDSVTIPQTVSYIGSESFENTGSGSFECLGSPRIDSKALAFSGYDKINFDGGDLSAPYIMNGCNASAITFGEGVEKIGQDCMSGCINLSSVSLPHALKKLGRYCMADDPRLHSVTIPERLELIPEGCFNETNLDVIIIPENITGMEHFAITSAAYLVLTNPKIKLAMEAFNVERVYLSGVHVSDECPVGLEYQYVSLQVYLAMDTTPHETENMDNFLNGIGFGEIAWIGTEPFLLPDDSTDFKINEDYELTSYTGDPDGLYIPHCAFGEEGNSEIYGVQKKSFRGKQFKEIYFNPALEIIPSNVFAEDEELTDLWFSGAVTYQMAIDTVKSGCFYGLPDNITVHLPARIDKSERAALEEKLKIKGIPNSAVFDYYTL